MRLFTHLDTDAPCPSEGVPLPQRLQGLFCDYLLTYTAARASLPPPPPLPRRLLARGKNADSRWTPACVWTRVTSQPLPVPNNWTLSDFFFLSDRMVGRDIHRGSNLFCLVGDIFLSLTRKSVFLFTVMVDVTSELLAETRLFSLMACRLP